ncbi:MAG: T9SS type A sorting domain-containing protein [Bacteroidota bacterium]
MQKLLLTLSFLLITNFLFAQCSGTPVGGTAIFLNSTCTPIQLGVTGCSIISGQNFSLQWEENYLYSGWVNIGTNSGVVATTPNDSTTFVSGNIYSSRFRLKITCNNSGFTAYSDSSTLLLNYCIPMYNIGTSSGFYIDRVKIMNGSLDNISGASTVAPFYTDFCSTFSGSLMQGTYNEIRIYTGSNISNYDIGVWIDFNQDGDFVDAGEFISGNSLIVPGGLGNYGVIGFTVPVAATIGYTKLRVRISGNTNAVLDPCQSTSPNYDFGESEDYTININANSCTGGTVAGTISVGSAAGNIFCMNQSGNIGNLVGWQFDWTSPLDFNPPDNSLLGDTLCFDTSLITNSFYSGLPMYARAMYQNNGCPVAYSNAVLLESPCPIAITDTVTDASCGNSDGAIAVTVTGGVAQSYLWSNGETTEDVSNLLAGNYSVTVTDTSSCFNSFSFTVNNSNGPTATETHLNSTCAGGTGSIDLSVTGGILPNTYSWNNGSTTEDVNSLLPGNYTVTITDFNNCSTSISATILNQAYSFYTFISSINSNCTSGGTLTANVYNGIMPYSFLWNNGATTQVISNLAAGNYSLTVTDNSGCQISVLNYSLSFSGDNVIIGKTFSDFNNNCVFDTGDVPISSIDIEANDNAGNYYYGFTDINGDYSILIPNTGTFYLNAYTFSYCGLMQSCFGGSVSFISTCDTISGVDFVQDSSSNYDLEIFPFCYSSNPGFDKKYDIDVYDNNYPYYIDTVTTTFIYDTALIYNYSVGLQPTWDSLNHTLTWKEPNINFGGYYQCYLSIPATVSTTALLHSEFYVNPISDDCYLFNNSVVYDEPVTSSWDPNSKQVSPTGNLMSADSVLTYTIHFQNTGNDTTHFVILKDTLSQYLNPATVENITASAPFDFNISGNGILTWIFNPLFLPDSASNEAMSKGFVQFKVKVKPNLPNGALIENTASIYFDYNLPIVTNTVQNSIINSVQEVAYENDLTIYPNPFNNQLTVYSKQLAGATITITDILGREVFRSQTNLKSVICNLQLLPQGIYFLKTTNKNGETSVRKIIKQ